MATQIAAQNRTLEQATRNGDHWTQADLDFIRDRTSSMTDEQLALVLGRTLYAVQSVQHTPMAERAERYLAPTRPVTAWDRGYTSLEAMGW